MAKLIGGLHGRPAGNVGGIIYGAARTRIGKLVTARELVYPSNPQTAPQMLQRHIFLEALYAVRHLGPTLYQDDWNRAIGQLPGFQSMMSIVLNGTDALEVFSAPADTPLGNLHFPGTFSIITGAGAPGTVQASWSTELGLNGTANDVIEVFGIEADATVDYRRGAVDFAATDVRSTGALTIATGASSTDWVVGAYFQGAGAAVGLLSLCRWTDVTSHA
jgi:hypothetical protein